MAYGATLTLPTITGSHTDFPIVLKESDFPTAAKDGGTNSLLNGGGDLRAYTSDAKTTQLPLDVVTFVTGGAPDIVVWVKVPTAATGNTVYIEADSVATTQPAVTNTYGRNAVWSDYEAVLHLNESGNGTAGEFVDSTGNGYDGQLTTGSSLSSVSTGHPFGSTWADFTKAEAITLASSGGLVANTAYTISIWADVDESDNGDGIFSNRYSSSDRDWTQLSASRRFLARGASVSDSYTWGDRPLVNEYVAGTHDSTELILYANGVELGKDTTMSAGETIASHLDFRIGTYYQTVSDFRYNGRAGEARVRQSVLSASWLLTENDNQGDTAAWTTASSWADTGVAPSTAWANDEYYKTLLSGNSL